MFSAIATLIGIHWVVEHKIETIIILAVFIFLIYRLLTRNRRLARKAQEAARLREQEAARRRAEEDRQRAERERREEQERQQKIAQKEDAIRKAIEAAPGSEKYRLPKLQEEVTVSGLTISEFKIESHGKYTVLDFETTGLSYSDDAIVEIGAVKVVNGEIVSRYHQYVDPCRSMPAEASAVNHITDSMLAGKPKIYELLPSLLVFIGDDIVVAHNAGFDIRFLSMACMRHRFACPKRSFDSMQLKELWPELTSKKLSSFLAATGIENKSEHSASGDAEALARLMIVSMQKPYKIILPDNFDFGYSSGHFTGTVEPVDSKLKGKKFVITGEVEGYEREDFEKMIAEHGGKCTIKISTATDYLIVGLFKKLPDDYVSAKEEYARKLISEGGKIQIISPDDLFAMIRSDE